jgi:hypothetical protein
VVPLRSSSCLSPDLVLARPFPSAFTTIAFGYSRRRWFETCSCKPVSRGLPSSVKQLRTTQRFLLSCSWDTSVPFPWHLPFRQSPLGARPHFRLRGAATRHLSRDDPAYCLGIDFLAEPLTVKDSQGPPHSEPRVPFPVVEMSEPPVTSQRAVKLDPLRLCLARSTEVSAVRASHCVDYWRSLSNSCVGDCRRFLSSTDAALTGDGGTMRSHPITRDGGTTAASGCRIPAIQYCLLWNSPVRFQLPRFGQENLASFADRGERVKNPLVGFRPDGQPDAGCYGMTLPGWDHIFCC